MPTILIIEDNTENLDLMSCIVKKHSFECLTAKDGEKGIALALEKTPDLIICDIQLVDIDGFVVMEMLKNNPKTANIPVIAITAYAMIGDREKVLAAGFSGYLVKPIEPTLFSQQIQSFVGSLKNLNKNSLSAKSEGQSILIVDDNSAFTKLYKIILQSGGYQCLVALNVKEAISLLETNQVDLIISDMQFPNESGIDLLKFVKNNVKLKALPFAIFSATFCDKDIEKLCLGLGAIKVFVKPSDPTDFLNIVQELLAK